MPPGADTTTPPTSNDGYRCDETHQAIDSGDGRIALESSRISSMPRTLPAVTEEKNQSNTHSQFLLIQGAMDCKGRFFLMVKRLASTASSESLHAMTFASISRRSSMLGVHSPSEWGDKWGDRN